MKKAADFQVSADGKTVSCKCGWSVPTDPRGIKTDKGVLKALPFQAMMHVKCKK